MLPTPILLFTLTKLVLLPLTNLILVIFLQNLTLSIPITLGLLILAPQITSVFPCTISLLLKESHLLLLVFQMVVRSMLITVALLLSLKNFNFIMSYMFLPFVLISYLFPNYFLLFIIPSHLPLLAVIYMI